MLGGDVVELFLEVSWVKLDTANRSKKSLFQGYDKAISMYKKMLARGQDAIG